MNQYTRLNEEQIATHESEIVNILNDVVGDHIDHMPPAIISAIFMSSSLQILLREQKNLNKVYKFIDEVIDRIIQTGEERSVWDASEFYFDNIEIE